MRRYMAGLAAHPDDEVFAEYGALTLVPPFVNSPAAKFDRFRPDAEGLSLYPEPSYGQFAGSFGRVAVNRKAPLFF